MSVTLSAIVAMSQNRCIGLNNDLPWHIPADLKHFKEKTSGKPIIMGRKTFESILERIGQPLPKRHTYVISRAGFSYEHLDVEICSSLDHALETAKAKNPEEIIIGGGAQIYELALPLLDKIYLTQVNITVEGDSFFPDLPSAEWTETAREEHEGDPSYAFCELKRIKCY